MNKKAQEMGYKYLGYLVLAVIIVLVFFSVNTKIKNSTYYIEQKYVKDAAFIHDAALASPQKLEAQILLSKNYTVSYDENQCSYSIKKEAGEIPISYYCGQDYKTNFDIKQEEGILKIEK